MFRCLGGAPTFYVTHAHGVKCAGPPDRADERVSPPHTESENRVNTGEIEICERHREMVLVVEFSM